MNPKPCLAAFSLVSYVSGPMYPEVRQAGSLIPKAGKDLVVGYGPGGFAGKAANMLRDAVHAGGCGVGRAE